MLLGHCVADRRVLTDNEAKWLCGRSVSLTLIREVIDHPVQIGSAAIEQPDHRREDLPNLIGVRNAYPDLRLLRMDAPARLVIADQPIPGAR